MIDTTKKFYIGETLERKIERITLTGEPISEGAPVIYTEREEGVIPAYDIRTDKFELAMEAMEQVSRKSIEKRTMAQNSVKGMGEQPKAKDGETLGGGGEAV